MLQFDLNSNKAVPYSLKKARGKLWAWICLMQMCEMGGGVIFLFFQVYGAESPDAGTEEWLPQVIQWTEPGETAAGWAGQGESFWSLTKQIRLLANFLMFVVTDFPFSERTKNLTGDVLDLKWSHAAYYRVCWFCGWQLRVFTIEI